MLPLPPLRSENLLLGFGASPVGGHDRRQLLRIEKKAMMQALHHEHALSDMFGVFAFPQYPL